MRRYPLEQLDHAAFEALVIQLCQKVLGQAVKPFAEGKDKGRDGVFKGRANAIPSEKKPWEGQWIIQAKHTNQPDASCSDRDFITLLEKNVLPSIEARKAEGKMDYYLLFTNRKMTGGQDMKIDDLIQDKVGVPNLVFGIEKIHHWLATMPDVVKATGLNQLLLPFHFDDADLREVVVAISGQNFQQAELHHIQESYQRLDLTDKNALNQLSQRFFEEVIQREFDAFGQIKRFLADPAFAASKDRYLDAVAEINAKISLHREDFAGFEHVIEHLYDLAVQNQLAPQGKKRLIRTVLYYMYCNCDIGRLVP